MSGVFFNFVWIQEYAAHQQLSFSSFVMATEVVPSFEEKGAVSCTMDAGE
jgi:hypothetical protein